MPLCASHDAKGMCRFLARLDGHCHRKVHLGLAVTTAVRVVSRLVTEHPGFQGVKAAGPGPSDLAADPTPHVMVGALAGVALSEDPASDPVDLVGQALVREAALGHHRLEPGVALPAHQVPCQVPVVMGMVVLPRLPPWVKLSGPFQVPAWDLS
ncbi:hypothetical protein ACWD4K_22750 [Streptomyces gelaticus]